MGGKDSVESQVREDAATGSKVNINYVIYDNKDLIQSEVRSLRMTAGVKLPCILISDFSISPFQQFDVAFRLLSRKSLLVNSSIIPLWYSTNLCLSHFTSLVACQNLSCILPK